MQTQKATTKIMMTLCHQFFLHQRLYEVQIDLGRLIFRKTFCAIMMILNENEIDYAYISYTSIQ